MMFSDDAVGLEATLHKMFEQRRVNKVNQRKEYFFASPREVRDALTPAVLDHYKVNLLEFIEYPEAEEFRLSQGAAA